MMKNNFVKMVILTAMSISLTGANNRDLYHQLRVDYDENTPLFLYKEDIKCEDLHITEREHLEKECEDSIKILSIIYGNEFNHLLHSLTDNRLLNIILETVPNLEADRQIEILTFDMCFPVYLKLDGSFEDKLDKPMECPNFRKITHLSTFTIPSSIDISKVKDKVSKFNRIHNKETFRFDKVNNSLLYVFNSKPEKEIVLRKYWEKVVLLISIDNSTRTLTILMSGKYGQGVNPPSEKDFRDMSIDYPTDMEAFSIDLKNYILQ